MAPSKGVVAFVVDDENIIASTLDLILRSEGFDVRSFVDPLDALAAAQSTEPHLLITDVMMPGMNGIELAIEVTLAYPRCKVLLFSGQAATEDLRAKARRSGYEFELLAKPVHPEDLIKKIKDIMSK